ncbi:MAG TPA: CapA family protein [Jatrophihabitantaceae bacterium]|jgi:poly-gamma-glutamate synthesis protein (capsule biosynthesis protein)
MNRRQIAVLVVGAVGALGFAGCDGHHDERPAPTLHVTVTHTVTPSAPQLPQPSRPRTVTVIGSGDVLIHPPVWEQAAADARAEGRTGYDFGPIYASVASRTRAADVAICELETPLAPPGGPFQGYPTFSAPPQVLTALRGAGYDSCTTASNHTIDQGFAGLKRTLDELDAAGLKHTGSARTPTEAARGLIITLGNGARVAQLAYSFGFNGLTRPAGQEWSANLTDVPTILAAARRAKAAGADIVVLSLHWGVEYNHGVTDEQVAQAHALLASPDIDVILGDHSHAVEPFERINGKWVAYSMGDQISRHAEIRNDDREGAMPRFTFTEVAPHTWKTTLAEAIPTWVDVAPNVRLIDLPAALASSAPSAAVREGYQAAHQRIAGYLAPRGAVKDGLIIR